MKTRFSLLAAVALLAIGPAVAAQDQSISVPGDATSTTITPQDLARRDKAMRDRIDKLEKVVKSLHEVVTQSKETGQPVLMRLVTDPDPAVTQLSSRLDDMDATVRTINGRLDDITHDIDLTRKTLADDIAARRELSDKIDKLTARMTAVEAAAQPTVPDQGAAPAPQPGVGPAQASSPSPAGPETPPPAANPEAAFAQGKALLLSNDYANAAAVFQDFVERFPDASQAPEARYWLGEALFVQNAYPDAATAYISAIRGWPKTTWAPNATVKLAQSLLALNKPTDACTTLAEFDRHYPRAPGPVAARAAAAKAQGKCS